MHLIDPSAADFDAICRSFRWSVPEQLNIARQVCDRHRDRSDQVALYFENRDGAREAHTFGQVKSLSDRLANALRGLGLAAGDRVAIILPQRPETAIAHLACYKAALVALPLSILFGPDALEYRLKDSGAAAVITDASRWEAVRQLKPDLPDLRRLAAHGKEKCNGCR